MTAQRFDSKALRAARKAADLTQDQLADLAGVTGRAIRNYEAGRVPSLDTAARLADALGLKVGDLLRNA